MTGPLGDPAITSNHAAWEELFRAKEWGKYPQEHVVRGIARNFYSATNRGAIKLLEIGCGPGANIWFMAREGFSVAGIDGSPTAIGLATARLASESLAADLRVGDFTNLPWPDSSFDGILENVSLYANPWTAIQQALGEVRRVLKPRGVFLCSFFTEKTWGYGTGTMAEPDGFVDIPEGPMAGTGFALYLNRKRLDELLKDFTSVHVERVSWTMGGEQHLVEQFVIECRNP
jgi:ubiquinone/menaquinone biosynthesis C-methylase UbiE